METEQWRPVVGWEGYYEVSDQGRVRTVERVAMRRNGRPYPVKPRILKTYTCGDYGHQSLKMKRDGTRGSALVHRLVLEAFVGPCPPKMECRHLDGNSRNNALSNLRWGSSAENSADLAAHGRQYPLQKTHCPYGHEYDGTTVTTGELKADGTKARKRICRTCRNARERQKYWRQRQQQVA